MAVTIVNITDTTFTLDGIEYQKNFNSIVSNDNVKIIGVYDSKVVLIADTNYAEYTVDGSSYGSALLLQAALVEVLFTSYQQSFDGRLSAVESGQKGIIYFDSAAPTEDGYYRCGNDGIYTNYGGLVVDLTTGINDIFVSAVQTQFDLGITPVDVIPTGDIEEGETLAVNGGDIFDWGVLNYGDFVSRVNQKLYIDFLNSELVIRGDYNDAFTEILRFSYKSKTYIIQYSADQSISLGAAYNQITIPLYVGGSSSVTYDLTDFVIFQDDTVRTDYITLAFTVFKSGLTSHVIGDIKDFNKLWNISDSFTDAIYRTDKRLFLDGTNQRLIADGSDKDTLQSEIMTFTISGVEYKITGDGIYDISLSGGFDQLAIPIATGLVTTKTYTVDEIVIFNDHDDHDGFYTIAKVILFTGISSSIIFDYKDFNFLRCSIPDIIYCAVNYETNIYYDTAWLMTQQGISGFDYTFETKCIEGESRQRCFRITPTTTGTLNITFNVYDKNKNLVSSKVSQLIKTDSNPATFNLLGVGDSLTNDPIISTTIRDNFIEQSKNIPVLIGTQGIAPNQNEGRGGWTTGMFSEPDNIANPFSDGVRLNFQNYVSVNGLGSIDVVTYQLGVNDINTGVSVATAIQNMKDFHTGLIDATYGYPSAKLHIVLPTSSANTVDAWGVSYGASKDIQIYLEGIEILREEINKTFGSGAYNASVFVSSAGLSLDRYYGYTFVTQDASARITDQTEKVHDNALHPAPKGYRQIGDGIFGSLIR